MRKFTQRVLILGAAEIAITGVVGGVDLFAAAQADPATCVSAAGLCQSQTTGPHAKVAIVCQPTGPKAGADCRRLVGHAA